MSIKEDRRINCDECLIVTDSDVKHLLDITIPYNSVGDILLKIARDMSNLYSFTDYQTYPRPSHPKLSKRLSPEFTFCSNYYIFAMYIRDRAESRQQSYRYHTGQSRNT